MLVQTIMVVVALTLSRVSSLVLKAYRARGALDQPICAALPKTTLREESLKPLQTPQKETN